MIMYISAYFVHYNVYVYVYVCVRVCVCTCVCVYRIAIYVKEVSSYVRRVWLFVRANCFCWGLLTCGISGC